MLVLIFLVRGVFVLSVLPPFEGWDEYQHIAYIEFLLEKGHSPVLNHDSLVPTSLYPDLVKYPHCRLSAEQLHGIGARNYGDFWTAGTPPAVLPNPPAVSLYQAQHSALYYQCVAPIYARLKASGGLLAAITGLRMINVLMGAAAIWIALWGVGRLIRPGPHRMLLGLLIALQPLYLLNCARVANDGLALLLGTVAVVWLLLMRSRHDLIGALGAGLVLGVGVLAKTINLSLLPFAAFVFFSMAWRKRISARRAIAGAMILFAVVTAVCFHYFRANLQQFGVLTPMQEAVMNHDQGRGLADFFHAATQLNWWGEISKRYLRHILWRGSWSMLSPPAWLTHAHELLFILAACGGGFLLQRQRRRRQGLFLKRGVALDLVVLNLGMMVGLCYHILHAYVALGSVSTNIWYASVTFPWLLVLFYQGLAGYRRLWITHLCALSMLGVYLITEIYGTLFQMTATYTGHAWGTVARQRLSQMHLPGLGPTRTIPALVILLTLVMVSVAIWARCIACDRPDTKAI